MLDSIPHSKSFYLLIQDDDLNTLYISTVTSTTNYCNHFLFTAELESIEFYNGSLPENNEKAEIFITEPELYDYDTSFSIVLPVVEDGEFRVFKS